MTAKDVLESAAVAGFEITLKEDGCTPTIKHQEQARPNAALMAALRTHRREIVVLLGGYVAPEWCPGHPHPNPPKKHPDAFIECKAWVYEPVDSENFCRLSGCRFRKQARGA